MAFYRHHGFMPLLSQPRTLFLPVATAEKTLLFGFDGEPDRLLTRAARKRRRMTPGAR